MTERQNLLYLQLPVAVSYHWKIGNVVTLQPYAGIYYGYGVYGKLKYDDGSETVKTNLFDSDVVEGEPVAQTYRRSDFGLRFGLGADFSNFYVGIGYDMGMLNLLKDKELRKNVSVKNDCVYVQVGYNF